MPSATDLLREDHHKVKDLFREFDEADDATRRKAIAEQTFMELDIHAQIEEEVFYPAIRRQRDASGKMDETMNEADEEHHVVKLLMAELKSMRAVDGKYVAKFTVLAENVKHHIGEEEAEIFTKAAEEGSEYLQDLGAKMEARKMQLMASYGKSSARKGTAAKKSTARKRVGTTTSRMKKGAGMARARTKTATKAAAKKTKTAARKTGTATKKTARKASVAAKSSTRAAKSTVRKATKSVRRTAKKATRR